MMGIYCITNLVNGKKYIGQSVNIKRRWYQERKGKVNKYLLGAFEKYGLENFSFEVLEECSREELNLKEKEYIALFETTDREKGYNLTTGGEHFKVVNIIPMSEETRKKISESKKGQPFSEEHKRNLKIARNKRPPLSEETKRKISESQKGKIIPEETRRKISEAKKGKKLTETQMEAVKKHADFVRGKTYEELYGEEKAEEKKQKMRESQLGKKMSEEAKRKITEKSFKRKVKCSNGKIYNSIREAAKDTNNLPSNIVEVCKGRQKTSHGLVYEYA